VLTLNYTHSGLGQVSVRSGRSRLLLLLADTTTAGGFWVQHTAGGPVLVQGASLLRTASVQRGRITLTGDTTRPGPITVWAARTRSLSWDGAAVATTRVAGGALTGTLPGAPASIALPSLSTGWRFEAESPETQPGFDDSSWPVADHAVTDNPIQPASAPVLYAQDYGFDHGFVWYRGHFTGTGQESALSLTADTGGFGSFAVWLNGHYLGAATTPTAAQSMSDTPVSQTFTIPAGTVTAGKDNVISVLVQNMGQDESFENSLALDSNKTPRGLESAVLSDSGGATAPAAPAVTWRLQGASAAQTAADPTRGPTNPAGLFGSNAGWALPSFNDSAWTAVSLPDSWATRSVPPGVGWYRTQFSLNVPSGIWAPLGLKLTPPGGGVAGSGQANYQALIYLNGWLIGRYINNMGPQNTFYLPQGLLRTNGANTLAIAEWSLSAGAGGLGTVSLVPYEIARGGIAVRTVASPG
jgi:hypothetical protein